MGHDTKKIMSMLCIRRDKPWMVLASASLKKPAAGGFGAEHNTGNGESTMRTGMGRPLSDTTEHTRPVILLVHDDG